MLHSSLNHPSHTKQLTRMKMSYHKCNISCLLVKSILYSMHTNTIFHTYSRSNRTYFHFTILVGTMVTHNHLPYSTYRIRACRIPEQRSAEIYSKKKWAKTFQSETNTRHRLSIMWVECICYVCGWRYMMNERIAAATLPLCCCAIPRRVGDKWCS